jgi:glycerophosphoryl diester phosphodiesterase
MRTGAPLALALLVGCGEAAPPPGSADAGHADAGPLAPAAAYLDPARYDCGATGPFEPPARPHPAGCFADPACRSRLAVAHRIATPFAPENSLSALRAAILLGVDVVETDVRLTADGRVVLLHDATLDRTTTATGAVSRWTLAALREVPLRVPDHVPPGDFSCDRVPTLEDAAALARGRVVLELEVKDRAAGVAAAEYLRREGLERDAFILCDPSECRAVRAAVPDAPIMSRARGPGDVAEALDFDPPPLMVHIDPNQSFLVPEVMGPIRAAGAKVFGNAFLLGDAEAAFAGSLEGYLRAHALGLDVVQAENPHWHLAALGRLPRAP